MFQNLHPGQRLNLELDAGHLHLVVEVAGDRAGDLHLGVEQAFEGTFIVAIDDCLHRPAIQEYAKESEAQRRCWVVGFEIGGANHAAQSNQLAIGLGTDHLLEAGLQGLGQWAVTYDGDVTANHEGPKTFAHGSAHQDAIAGSKLQGFGSKNEDRVVAVLHKEVTVVRVVVGDGGFEDDRRVFACLIVVQRGRGVQRGQSGRRIGPRAGSAQQKHREPGNHPLHIAAQESWMTRNRPYGSLSAEGGEE